MYVLLSTDVFMWRCSLWRYFSSSSKVCFPLRDNITLLSLFLSLWLYVCAFVSLTDWQRLSYFLNFPCYICVCMCVRICTCICCVCMYVCTYVCLYVTPIWSYTCISSVYVYVWLNCSLLFCATDAYYQEYIRRERVSNYVQHCWESNVTLEVWHVRVFNTCT